MRLSGGITCDATLWAACNGGALQVDDYRAAVESAGLRVTQVKDNPKYRFVSTSGQGATTKFGDRRLSAPPLREG